MTPTLFALFGYLLVQFGIGAFVARRLRSDTDYLVAGRSLGWGLGTFTIFATWFGAETVGCLAFAETWAIPVCGSVVATELVARVISARSARVASGSALLAGGLYLLIGLIPVGLGLEGPALVPELTDPEQLLPGPQAPR